MAAGPPASARPSGPPGPGTRLALAALGLAGLGAVILALSPPAPPDPRPSAAPPAEARPAEDARTARRTARHTVRRTARHTVRRAAAPSPDAPSPDEPEPEAPLAPEPGEIYSRPPGAILRLAGGDEIGSTPWRDRLPIDITGLTLIAPDHHPVLITLSPEEARTGGWRREATLRPTDAPEPWPEALPPGEIVDGPPIDPEPRDFGGYMEEALRFMTLGDRDSAIDALTRAHELRPDAHQPHQRLCALYKRRDAPGDRAAALTHCRRWLALEPDPTYRPAVERVIEQMEAQPPADE